MLSSLKTKRTFVTIRNNAEWVKDGLHTKTLHYFLHKEGNGLVVNLRTAVINLEHNKFWVMIVVNG